MDFRQLVAQLVSFTTSMPVQFNTVVLAIAGYLFTYWHTKTADARKANIERINEQLRELYGPLLSCITATKSTYKTMVQAAPLQPRHGQSRSQAFREALTTDPQGKVAEAYR
eukprot:jgi/Ulvmu1/9134/UM005_0232.1